MLLKSAPENIYLKTCSASFSRTKECLLSDLNSEHPSVGVEGQQLKQE